MTVKLKKLEHQTVIVTGATSGIGLTTARMAARRGARLVLAARNEEALQVLTAEIRGSGGRAVFVTADVGNIGDVRKIAAEAINQFGSFDTWINNAGVTIYGKLTEVPMEDHRRLFDTNYWGIVHGSVIAAEHLRLSGGAIINVGSILSDRSIPLQGTYCASKHAIKGFTESLRMEIEADNLPISVSLIKPAAIDTPVKDHARNLTGLKPEFPPPVYAPDAVAEAILHCAENQVRDLNVGGGGRVLTFLSALSPRITDKGMELGIGVQLSGEPSDNHTTEGLYTSRDASLRERGGYGGHVAESSLYTKASLHPIVTGAAIVALGAGLAYWAVKR